MLMLRLYIQLGISAHLISHAPTALSTPAQLPPAVLLPQGIPRRMGDPGRLVGAAHHEPPQCAGRVVEVCVLVQSVPDGELAVVVPILQVDDLAKFSGARSCGAGFDAHHIVLVSLGRHGESAGGLRGPILLKRVAHLLGVHISVCAGGRGAFIQELGLWAVYFMVVCWKLEMKFH